MVEVPTLKIQTVPLAKPLKVKNSLTMIRSIELSQETGLYDVLLRRDVSPNKFRDAENKRSKGILLKTEGGGWMTNLYRERGEGELQILMAMHAADPVHTVRPIAVIKREEDGLFTGYVMERLEGFEDVREVLKRHPEHKTRMIQQVEEFVAKLDENKIVHGDLYIDNVLANEVGDIKIIDPFRDGNRSNSTGLKRIIQELNTF